MESFSLKKLTVNFLLKNRKVEYDKVCVDIAEQLAAIRIQRWWRDTLITAPCFCKVFWNEGNIYGESCYSCKCEHEDIDMKGTIHFVILDEAIKNKRINSEIHCKWSCCPITREDLFSGKVKGYECRNSNTTEASLHFAIDIITISGEYFEGENCFIKN